MPGFVWNLTQYPNHLCANVVTYDLFSSVDGLLVTCRSAQMSVLGENVWKLARDHINNMNRTSEVLQQRFIDIRHPTGSHLSTNSARKRKNLARNRYTNILPFDHNCVKVYSNAEDQKRGKYVNASIIEVCSVSGLCTG